MNRILDLTIHISPVSFFREGCGEDDSLMLDKADYLDPFQLGFRFGPGTRTILITLLDYLWQDLGGKSVLIFLDLSATFDIINNGILMVWFQGSKWRAQFCTGSLPFYGTWC